MTSQSSSLQDLRDIFVPDPPPMWPPSPGVWVVLVIALCVLLALFMWLRQRRAHSAYRRAGLDLLPAAGTARDVNVVLKRVALAVFPRPRVAQLYGNDWAAFLNSTCPRDSFDSLAGGDPTAEATSELRRLAGIWIRHHHVSKDGS